MKVAELFDWLTREALYEDIAKLTQLTVATEITNLEPSFATSASARPVRKV
jgi:hypothetical protein